MAAPSVNVYYTKPIMPDVSRVLACLYEKKIDFEPIDIYEGQHSVSGDLLKLRSRASSRIHGAAIEDGDTRLFESRAICRYLAEKYSARGSRLLGRDPLERAAIEQWLKFEEHRFDPPSWELAFYLGFAAAPPDPAAVRDGVRKLSEVLDVYEQRLGESEFLAGDEFTMADLFHLPNSHHLLASGLSHSAHPEVSELFSSRRNVSRWWKAISGRPSWKNVVDLLNGVPVQRTSLLAGAPDNGHGWGPRFAEAKRTQRPSSSPPLSTTDTTRTADSVQGRPASPSPKTGAEAASQQPLLPPPQPRAGTEASGSTEPKGINREHTSPAKATQPKGDPAEIATSQRPVPPQPPKTGDEEGHRPSPQSTTETALPRKNESPIRKDYTPADPQRPASSSPIKDFLAEAGLQSSARTAQPKNTKVGPTDGANAPARPSSQLPVSPHSKNEKGSPQVGTQSRQIPGTDSSSPVKPDSQRPASSSPPKAEAIAAPQAGTQTVQPKNTTVEPTNGANAPARPASQQPGFSPSKDGAEASPQAGARSRQIPGTDSSSPKPDSQKPKTGTEAALPAAIHSAQPKDTKREPTSEGNARARPDSQQSVFPPLPKDGEEASPQAGTRSRQIPGTDSSNPPKTDFQRPSSSSPPKAMPLATPQASTQATEPEDTKVEPTNGGNAGALPASRRSVLSPPSKDGAEASPLDGTRSRQIPGTDSSSPPKADSQRPASSLPPKTGTEAAPRASSQPTIERPQLNGANADPSKIDRTPARPAPQPPGPSPRPRAGPEAAPPADNTRPGQASAANGASLSIPEAAGGGAAEARSNQAGGASATQDRKGDDSRKPTAETDPSGSTPKGPAPDAPSS